MVPFGFRIETLDEVIVTWLKFRLIRCPAVPANEAVDVVPAGVTLTTTEAPPGTIV